MSITRVQGQATASSGTVTSQAATISSGATLGNLLIADVSTGAIGNSVTPPSGWSQAVFNQPNSPANDETGIWYIVAGAGQSGATSFTFTFGSSHNVYIIITEWSATNGWNASPSDQTAVGNTAGTAATSTTPNTGTTSTTTQASELWIASLAYSGGVQTESSITSGWTKDLETHDGSNNHTVTALYQIASSTGTASCQYTIGTAEHWAGAVATFKPIVVTTVARTVPSTAVLMATVSRTITSTAVLLGTTNRTILATAVLLQTTSRTIPATADIAVTTSRTIPATAVLDQPVSRTIPATAVLMSTVSRTITATAVLQSLGIARTVPSAAVLMKTTNRTVPATVDLANTVSRTITATVSLANTVSRTVLSTAVLKGTVSRTIPATADLKTTVSRTIPATVDLTLEIASGGFTLFANGNGTVSYDHFRVTQYPDPALSLSRVTPRLGTSSVSWDVTTPTNTTLAVKTSLDGVNFTDVTSGNGGSIPGLTSQIDPIIDLFDANSSANYTSTNITGGATATPTFDTSNSRLVLVGGTGGLCLYTSVTDNDVDMQTVMDYSDNGGLVWRYVDQSNYYELGCHDDSSSSANQNQLRLYKVVAGSRSLIGSASTVSWPRNTPGTSPYKLIRVSMLGTTINIYFDGTLVQTATDSTFTTGKMGLRNNGGTSRYYFWRFIQVGDYVSGTPIGDIVTGDFVYTQVAMTTSDPTVTPQMQDLTTTAYGPQLARGALITQLHSDTIPFAYFFNDEMKTLATASGDYWWDINAGSLTFNHRTAQLAPFCLHSADLLYAPLVQPTYSADLYRNRQNITNCLDTVTITNEQKIADGTASSWSLAYPVYSAPTITVQGVTKTVGVLGIDTGKDFYWQAGSVSISQDTSATVVQAGFIILASYVGQFTRTVTANNLPEQAARALVERGTGIVEAIEDGKGMLASLATVYATGLLAKHGNNSTVEIVAVTERAGLAQGMYLPVFIPEHSLLDALLLIVKVTSNPRQQLDGSVLYDYTIDATNGSNLSNWADALIK